MYMNCLNSLFVINYEELTILGNPRFIALYMNYEHTEFLMVPRRAEGRYTVGSYVPQIVYLAHGGFAFGDKVVAEALGIPERARVRYKREYNKVIYAHTFEGQRKNLKCEEDCFRVFLEGAESVNPSLSGIYNTYGALIRP